MTPTDSLAVSAVIPTYNRAQFVGRAVASALAAIALGEKVSDNKVAGATLADGAPDPEAIWAQLRQVFDPEIPVNIVDLGLVYSMDVSKMDPAPPETAACARPAIRSSPSSTPMTSGCRTSCGSSVP